MELPSPSLLDPPEDPDARDLWFMGFALREAAEAFDREEVPVGAVLVHEGGIVARSGNRCVELGDPTAHAEMLVLTEACAALGLRRLTEATFYSTLEPCFMCAGALCHARVARAVFGARDPKFGAFVSLAELPSDPRLNHRFPIREGVGAEESTDLLRRFFQARRPPGDPGP